MRNGDDRMAFAGVAERLVGVRLGRAGDDVGIALVRDRVLLGRLGQVLVLPIKVVHVPGGLALLHPEGGELDRDQYFQVVEDLTGVPRPAEPPAPASPTGTMPPYPAPPTPPAGDEPGAPPQA